MTEAMTPRERMLAAFRREPTDRVPTDIWATPEVWQKLQDCFGTPAQVRSALHIDGMANVGATYTGPPPAAPPGESADFWGIRRRPVVYAGGVYQEMSFNPLAAARSIDDLERYPWPRAEWFDYSQLRQAALQARQQQVVMCGYLAPFYYHNLLRGLEASLMDPLDDPAFTHHLMNRLGEFFLGYHRRMFEAAEGLIDVAQVTDDLGSQTGPLISLEIYREFYAPWHRRFIALCREFGITVFHHDDGSIRPFLPDLVEMGIQILNPLQWACADMELAGLKRDYGDRLCFHGGVDNQRILPFGTPAEVRAEVRHCIDELASDQRGYILAPCHNLQAVSPLENILAMYDEAWHYGKF